MDQATADVAIVGGGIAGGACGMPQASCDADDRAVTDGNGLACPFR
jgi:anaerobic glycerol-3-phosphate dehydrogenase